MEDSSHQSIGALHKYWFFSLPVQIIVCLFICLSPFMVQIVVQNISLTDLLKSQSALLIVPAVAVLASVFILRSMMMFPRNSRSSTMILSVVTGCFGGALLYFLAVEKAFSFWLFFCSYVLMLLCCFIGYFFARRYFSMKMAIIPLGRAKDMVIPPRQNYEWVLLDSPQWRSDCNILVADLHSPDLDESWQAFIADCVLKGIPVYNIRQMEEALTGRVRVAHMYENDLGTLQPSATYAMIKRVLDTLLIILSLPLVLPIMLITAILIKLEDGDSVFYIQPRIGQQGKVFQMYKFRSMRTQNNSFKPTTGDDERITKIGHFIRKFRIDELPQFLNVIVGDMSLIGPRAEFKNFADKLKKEVPFYDYRHIVKPGISGWAQVMHGHVISADDTKIKIEYDFYYIKHFSFALDLLIFFKTIKTILTGFGAK